MADLKTKPTDESVTAFLNAVADEGRRADCFAVLEMMRQASGAEPRMWGPSMVGFGHYHYRYDSGREGDTFQIGFSPRKADLTLYFLPCLDVYGELVARLGKHKAGKSCLYLKKLADVDLAVLREMLDRAVRHLSALNSSAAG